MLKWGALLGGMVAGSLLVGGLAALATAPLRPTPAPVITPLPSGPPLGAPGPGLPVAAGSGLPAAGEPGSLGASGWPDAPRLPDGPGGPAVAPPAPPPAGFIPGDAG